MSQRAAMASAEQRPCRAKHFVGAAFRDSILWLALQAAATTGGIRPVVLRHANSRRDATTASRHSSGFAFSNHDATSVHVLRENSRRPLQDLSDPSNPTRCSTPFEMAMRDLPLALPPPAPAATTRSVFVAWNRAALLLCLSIAPCWLPRAVWGGPRSRTDLASRAGWTLHRGVTCSFSVLCSPWLLRAAGPARGACLIRNTLSFDESNK